MISPQNTFSKKLAPTGFQMYEIFVVDQLHEIELGVWKSMLTHLIRILHMLRDGGAAITELDTRCVTLSLTL